MRWLSIAAALAGALLIPTTAPAQERPVDLELVLAVDASASVSDEEFNLQVRGLAEAFWHRSVSQAIRAAGDLGLAVALIQWADYDQHALSVDWTVVRDAASARQFAKQVDGVRRTVARRRARVRDPATRGKRLRRPAQGHRRLRRWPQ